jgi:hypothetical protein
MRPKTKGTNLLGSEFKAEAHVVLMAGIIAQGTEFVRVMAATIFITRKACKH